jgi:hypothetical protein
MGSQECGTKNNVAPYGPELLAQIDTPLLHGCDGRNIRGRRRQSPFLTRIESLKQGQGSQHPNERVKVDPESGHEPQNATIKRRYDCLTQIDFK